MAGTDDLAPLLAGGEADGRTVMGQATVLSYDHSNNTHTLNFHGSKISDVGVVKGISAMGYQPGDVVLLQGWVPKRGPSTWWILGQALIPGEDSPDLTVRGSDIIIEGGNVVINSGQLRATDSSGDVFRLDPDVPEIFMRPELISAVARQVIAEVIHTDEVAAFQSTSSTSYTDLSTVGPTLSDIEISDTGRMLVFVSAFINPAHNTSTGQLNEFGYMSYEISGPTNRAANDADALIAGLGTTVTSGDVSAGLFNDATKVSFETGLSPGTYTIQAKYKTEATLGGSPTTDFGARRLTVIAF